MRLHAAVIALFFLPLSLPAQASASANPITTTLTGFGFYGTWIRMAFDSIPAASYGFKPTPPQQSIGFIAQHLEYANYELCRIIGGVAAPRTARDSLPEDVKAQWPKDTLIARVKASLEFCVVALSGVTDASLAETLSVGPVGAQRQAPRVRWVILLITDLAEHYAQLASYMRILGLVPPSALPAAK